MTYNPVDGLIVVVKRDCPTCALVVPVLDELARGAPPLTVYVQDSPEFAAGLPGGAYDASLEHSWRLDIEIVPTLIRVQAGQVIDRCIGWHRGEWERVSGLRSLGAGLPDTRPGCGSKTQEPGMAEELGVRFGDIRLASRQIELGSGEDEIEACFERGWSDGLPVVPPTPVRVARMLAGTSRRSDEVLGLMPPDLVPCTVEKVAINAVMAGAKPEYMPVLLAAIEAALQPKFNMHGLLCTTHFAAPMVIVNGPAAQAIGMNSAGNVLGQGNRANATIGRTLQLVVRNVGGGRPGEIDMACLGNSGKYTSCFAESPNSTWEPLSVQRGIAAGRSAVTLFAAAGMLGIMDQKSRDPESLSRSYASAMLAVDHPKSTGKADVLLVISPEHARVFLDARWSKAHLIERLHELTIIDGDSLVPGAGGIAEGDPSAAGRQVPKFRPEGILVVRAGGGAGMMTAIIPSWPATGERGSMPATQEIAS